MLPRVLAAASWDANRLDLFGLGTDRAVYHKAWTGSAWQAAWENLGGKFNSPPAVVAWGSNRLDIFGLGTDDAIYHKAWIGSGWQTTWESLGGRFICPPVVVAWGPNRLDVFGVGTDRAMYHKAWMGSGWQADWENLGGAFNSPPAVVAWGPNRLDIVGLGTNDAMYHKAWTGSGWQAEWENLGGVFNSPPALVAWGFNRLDIVGLGTDNAMYHKAWTGWSWQGDWENLGGVFDSPPAVVAWGSNRLDIFGLGTDNAMYHKAWMGSAWQADWENLGGTFNSAPAAVAWASGRLDIVGLGSNDAMYHKAWTGSAWQADWENLGGVFYAPFGPGPASLLILAPDEFMAALQPLLKQKNETAMSALAVSISSLAPLFHGIDDAETVKNAIRYAHENLSTKYVMLVGDAHCFPTRYYFMHNLNAGGYGNQNSGYPADGSYIPSDHYYANLYHHEGSYPTLVPVTFDTWDANGNGLYNEATWLDPDPLRGTNPDNVDAYPDVAVGRVPAHTADDVATYVNKIIQYEWNADSKPIMFTFVADQPYPTADQLTANAVAKSNLMSKVAPSQINYLWVEYPVGSTPPAGWSNASTADVVSAAERSSWVSYIGHGGPNEWGHATVVFGDANVESIPSSNAPPIVFVAGCQTGRFSKGAPWGGEYVDVAGIHHNFQPYPNAAPNVPGPAITDTIDGQQWGFDWPGTLPIPLIGPKPNAYDYDEANLCCAYAWLIMNKSGGAIAYFGEWGIAEDQSGAELEGYVLGAYVNDPEPVPILGDSLLSAQRQYWANHQSDVGNQGGGYQGVTRFYLGWMVFFGDPSLRLPPLKH
jgi:hypothetical protein